MVSQDLHRVPRTPEIMDPVATQHDTSQHLLIAYGVVLLRW
jgi:hypothetical protein